MLPACKSTRGFTLIVALTLILIASLAVAGTFSYVGAIHRLNERTVARDKALATAEAGIHRLIHYFSHPEDLPSNLSANAAIIRTFFETMETAGLFSTAMVFIDAGADLNDDLIVFGPAHVMDLQVTWPRAGAVPGSLFTFRSTAECDTPHGGVVSRTVLMDVSFELAPRIAVPAGLISGGTVAANGHFNLHWGEAWTNGPLALELNRKSRPESPLWDYTGGTNQVDASDDEWVGYRTTNYVVDSGGTRLSDSALVHDVGLNCVAGSAADYRNILWQNEDAFTPTGQQTFSQKIDAVLEQFMKLGDPLKGYEFWKQASIRRDTYFRATSGAVYDSNGNQLFLGADGKLNTTGSGTALTASSAMEYYRGLDNVYVAFFDTVDGNPPALNGSNWVDIRFTGSISGRSKGVLYVAGHLAVGGSGTPPLAPIANPDEVEGGLPGSTQIPVFHDGVIYTRGNFNYQGNGRIYGSVVTGGDYQAGGNPFVYYNAGLKSSDPQPLSTRARIMATVLE